MVIGKALGRVERQVLGGDRAPGGCRGGVDGWGLVRRGVVHHDVQFFGDDGVDLGQEVFEL